MHQALTSSTTSLCAKLLPQQPVDDLRIGFPLRLLQHLADEEAEYALLAAAIRRNLIRVRHDDGVDRRLERRLVGRRALREKSVRCEAGAAALQDRVRIDVARQL